MSVRRKATHDLTRDRWSMKLSSWIHQITGKLRMSLRRKIVGLIYWVPALILRSLNIRFPVFFLSRIGHLLMEPDCFVKEQQLGLLPKYRSVILAPMRQVANTALLEYWRNYFWVVSSRPLLKLLQPFASIQRTSFDASKYAVAINSTAEFATVQAQWADRPPLLQLTSEDKQRGRTALEAMGMPANGWYVCVHSREGGYSPNDEHVHSYRNSEFSDYSLAINHVVSHGGRCIRMGDPSMAPIPAMRGVIDYAKHPLRAGWLDLYLAATCKFFLGNSSGAFAMASVFGRPVACSNMAPLGAVYPYGVKDIGIPKLFREVSTGRVLTFREIMESPISGFRFASQFQEAGIEVVNNTPDDIRELAIEQLERIDNSEFKYSEKDEVLQQRFRELFRPGHYAYGSASRVGRAFLQKHEDLLR